MSNQPRTYEIQNITPEAQRISIILNGIMDTDLTDIMNLVQQYRKLFNEISAHMTIEEASTGIEILGELHKEAIKLLNGQPNNYPRLMQEIDIEFRRFIKDKYGAGKT